MARRRLLTGEERRRLFDIPHDETAIVGHYTLAAEDLELVGRRYRPANRLGLATQIALMRHPGFGLQPDVDVPDAVLHYLAAQLFVDVDAFADYGQRAQTRNVMPTLRHGIWGYTLFGEGIYRSRSISPQELRSGPIGANLLSAH